MTPRFAFASLALCILLLAGCATAPPERFTFVVLGDSQFNNPETFEQLVQKAELLKPDLALHVGDMIHGYHYSPEKAAREWTRFQAQIAPFSAPFHAAPGNHDLTTDEMRPAYGPAWNLKKGKPYYHSFNYKRSHFIFLDLFETDDYYRISEAQQKWLRKDLEKNRNARHIFVTVHAPLYLDAKDYKETWDWLKQTLAPYPVKAMFTGHYHTYDYRRENSIDFFCLNSSGRMVGYSHLAARSHHFLFVNVNGDDVHYAVVEKSQIYPPDAVPVGEASRATPFIDDDKSILIPQPGSGPLDFTVAVPLHNRTTIGRTYTMNWESNDTSWSFDPPMQKVDAAPEQATTASFRIRGPGAASRFQPLPRLRIDSPYTTSSGTTCLLTHYATLFPPPQTSAVPLRSGFQFDGKVDDAAWRAVPSIGTLYLDETGTPAPETTEVKFAYDRQALYCAIWGEEPNPKGLIALARGKLPLVFGDDDFELFLDPKRNNADLYRLMTNSASTQFSSGPKGLFTYNFEVKTHIGDSFWSAEFRIPFDQLGVDPPTPGDRWGLNVRRHRMQADIPLVTSATDPTMRDWSPMPVMPLQPHRFGLLIFE